MYLLNNIHDRNYWEHYPAIDNVIFDITDKQLQNKKNKDWSSIQEGSLVCVIMSTRKVSTFYRVDSIVETEMLNEEDETTEIHHILTGEVVAKSEDREDLTRLLNKFNIVHPSLPKNKIGVGFNIADIGDGLAELEVKAADGAYKPLGEVEG